MAINLLKSGITDSTITTGTGTITLSGAVTPWIPFTSADDTKTLHYGIYWETGFEIGTGVYTHSSRTLTRPTIIRNSLGTSSPLELPGGSKEVSLVIPAERTAVIDYPNVFLADQSINGNKFILDQDGDTWIDSIVDDSVKLYIAGVLSAQFSSGNTKFTLTSSDTGTSEGPEFDFDRASTNPQVANALGVARWSGRDAGGNKVAYARVRASILGTNTGLHTGQLGVAIASGGSLVTVAIFRNDCVIIPFGFPLLTGKSDLDDPTAQGVQIDQTIFSTSSSEPALYANRLGGNGIIINFQLGNNTIGDISGSGTTVSYNAFTGGHYAEWAPGKGGQEFEKLGTVLATADGMVPGASDPVVYVQPASNGTRRVYGVYGARVVTKIVENTDMELLLVFAVGNGYIRCKGSVEAGDLLWASSTPGLAEPQPNQDAVGPWTIAKATQSAGNKPDHLVPCCFMAG